MSPHKFKRPAGLVAAAAALLALGATVMAPAPASADTGPMPVPGVDVAKIARQYGVTPTQVLQRQAELAPIIKRLAPRATQPVVKPRLKVSDVADAAPSECFGVLGGDHPAPDADGNCPAGYRPRWTQAYVFGSAVAGDNYYFGTSSGVLCGGAQAYFKGVQPFANDDIACEGSNGPNGRSLGWKGGFGDLARHEIKRVDTTTNQVHDITPTDEQAPYFKYGTGVRGAGSAGGVVLLGQQALNTTATGFAGMELVAYEADTGRFLGEKLFPEYANIRNGKVIDGDLYFGVRLAGGQFGGGGGIIKWTGSQADPFQFEVVATGLKSEPGYLVEHEGHIVTSGWTVVAPLKAPETAMAEMYQSPKIPAGGLTAATADPSNWKTIFKMSDFEPDPVIARAYQFGDITSYQGKLLFSTYTYAGYNTTNAFGYYGEPTDDVGRLNTMLGAERPISVLSMDNPGKVNQKVRLLYGDAKLPVYNATTKTWVPTNNKLNQAPKYGPAGFGNRFNTYSWMWTQYKGSLYMSTFDASSIVQGVFQGFNGGVTHLSDLTLALLQPVLDLNHKVLGGGDVWRFDSIDTPAIAENLNGFGSKDAHGVRAWGAFPEKNKLYAGMATWANLKEGWHLHELNG